MTRACELQLQLSAWQDRIDHFGEANNDRAIIAATLRQKNHERRIQHEQAIAAARERYVKRMAERRANEERLETQRAAGSTLPVAADDALERQPVRIGLGIGFSSRYDVSPPFNRIFEGQGPTRVSTELVPSVGVVTLFSTAAPGHFVLHLPRAGAPKKSTLRTFEGRDFKANFGHLIQKPLDNIDWDSLGNEFYGAGGGKGDASHITDRINQGVATSYYIPTWALVTGDIAISALGLPAGGGWLSRAVSWGFRTTYGGARLAAQTTAGAARVGMGTTVDGCFCRCFL